MGRAFDRALALLDPQPTQQNLEVLWGGTKPDSLPSNDPGLMCFCLEAGFLDFHNIAGGGTVELECLAERNGGFSVAVRLPRGTVSRLWTRASHSEREGGGCA